VSCEDRLSETGTEPVTSFCSCLAIVDMSFFSSRGASVASCNLAKQYYFADRCFQSSGLASSCPFDVAPVACAVLFDMVAYCPYHSHCLQGVRESNLMEEVDALHDPFAFGMANGCC
jgi:hypothetical protein